MNLLQLRSVCEIADNRLNISEAANTLFRTQSTVTRQIKELEDELGIEIFARRRNKVLGITPPGKELIQVARRMLRDAETLTQLNRRKAQASPTQITIASSYTQARYYLPQVISTFTARNPKVRFKILQGSPTECYQMLQTRQADLGLCSEAEQVDDLLVEIPSFRCGVIAIAPFGHPLLELKRRVTCEDITRYPLIVVDRMYGKRHNVSQALFVGMDIQPAIVLASNNMEICKSYVERGMGVALIRKIAFEDADKQRLGAIDLAHLCAPVTVNLVVRRDLEVCDMLADFIGMVAPGTADYDVRKLLSGMALPPGLDVPLH